MKTSRILAILMTATLLLLAGNAFAVTGACVNCHTMHDSQDGATMSFDGTGAQAVLLRAGSCAGCHADASMGGPGIGSLDIPQVDEATIANAGGSFNWVDATELNSPKGHNVADLVGVDFNLSSVPGFTTLADAGRGVDGWDPQTNQLTCAGVYGCHGAGTGGDFAAVKGAHHANPANTGSNVLAATSVGTSFRFLEGVSGIESITYPQAAGDHNVYLGGVTGGTAAPSDVAGTISDLCATCHGAYHATQAEIGGATSSTWIRHPTDIDMKNARFNGTEYASYVFDLETPVAVESGDLGTVTAASDAAAYDAAAEIVTCLSCHYAHGSANDDLLRFAYSGMTAGTGADTGCMNCHTTK